MSMFQNMPFIKPNFVGSPHLKSIGYEEIIQENEPIQSQVSALIRDGCCAVFLEKARQKNNELQRPQLQVALSTMDKGDELVVTKLNRLGKVRSK